MHWLQSLDIALFHFVNGTLSNPFFDWLMPLVSGGNGAMRWFNVAVVVGFVIAMIWGNSRARICALLILISLAGDPLVIGTIKNAVNRPRPCVALADDNARLPCGGTHSFPSAHSANWFAAAMIAFIFYRRSVRFMVPIAATVAFSRVYCGVHFPTDVLAGGILGAGYGAALVVLAQTLWNFIGRKIFPAWHERLPSLLKPETFPQSAIRNPQSEIEWLHLGYVVIALALIARWIYLAIGPIGLSEDEAYQWLWSKHLALSYYSKPPGIALIQWLGTHLFGDTNFGVRFFSPLFAAILSFIILRFLAREVGAKIAFCLLLATFATPLFVVGSILMTIDPPLVLCWMWAAVTGWRAAQLDGKTRDWFIVGLAMGLGFFCKYTALAQLVSFAIYFALQPSARIHLKKIGPWLALGIFALCTLPVVIWNSQHGWITVNHVAGDAGLHSQWHFTLKYLGEFTGIELGLLNPIFFIAMLWTMFAFWKNRKTKPLELFLFCMGAPLFLGYWLYAFHSRVQPNWIAPAMPPLFCLMAIYFRKANFKPWFCPALGLGIFASVFMYDSDLFGKLIAKLPGDKDPTHTHLLRGGREAALVVESARENFDTNAFIIADHYGTTGVFSFYSPAARAAAKTKMPLVYCVDSDTPINQFYFLDEYNYRRHRRGENAIFVKRLDPYPLESGWPGKWFRHEEIHYARVPAPLEVPERVAAEFESVTNLGVREVALRDGRIFQRVQIWGCYHLK